MKRLVLSFLPTAAHRRLRMRKQASKSHDHRDPTFIEVTPDITFETYWKDVEAGKGPALIVWCRFRKIMKFDCFGKGRGHYHISVPVYSSGADEADRIYLPEESVEAQVERVAFELKGNLPYFLARAAYRGARKVTVPTPDLLHAVDEARSLMYEHAETCAERGRLP